MNRLLGTSWASVILMFLLSSAALTFAQSGRPAPPFDLDGGDTTTPPQQKDRADADTNKIPDTPQPSDTQNKVIGLPKAFLHDQIGMWTSPSRIRFSDTTWMVPLGGFAAALFATDSDISRHLSNVPNTLTQSRHISDYTAYSMGGGAAGIYFLGLVSHNEHQRETGFLSGESAIDALIAVEALKYATGRQRPYQGTGTGQFWHSGTSFPSEHTAGAFAIAGIVSHEYPSPFVKFLSYGMATLGRSLSNHGEAALPFRRSCGRGHRISDQRVHLPQASQS